MRCMQPVAGAMQLPPCPMQPLHVPDAYCEVL